MESLIPWLIRVEGLAEQFYRRSAEALDNDDKLRRFLLHLAEEESEHSALLHQAYNLVRNRVTQYRSDVIADGHFRNRVEGFFDQNIAYLEERPITKDKVIRIILQSEFSEWNDLFLYVMERLKREGREFQQAASGMEKHRQSCITFLQPYPEYDGLIARLKELPELWRNKLLVVDDSESVRNLIEMVFRYEAEVFKTDDGREALALLEHSHFDFVVLDTQTRGMDGIRVFKKASENDPTFASRVLFFCERRALSHENEQLFKKLHVGVMEKPGNLTELMSIVRRAFH